MLIKNCSGYELEKEKPNTSEDFFNRSEVTFIEDGKEKTLNVLYVRFFEEQISEFTPFESNQVFQVGSRSIEFKDIVAVVCLMKNPGLRHRKRLYISNMVEFASYFKDVNFDKVESMFHTLEKSQEFKLQSPLEFIIQP